MKLLPLDTLGGRETSPGIIGLGVLFPWIRPDNGQRLFVKVIHERDQFLKSIPALEFELAHHPDPQYGDRWSASIDLGRTPGPAAGSAWGSAGRYVYRFVLRDTGGREIDWIVDPFAREFGIGKQSAVSVGATPHVWSGQEDAWRVPRLSDLVIYELMVQEFARDLRNAAERLEYLADLGITCVEIMPLSNISNEVDWGFLPMGYFGVDDRFGRGSDLRAFVDAAHRRGIAVILDVVYGHTSEQFPYSYLYRRLGYDENPFMGHFAKDYFGQSTDFGRVLTQDFFFTVNHHWLDAYHVDGFRYDCVPNYWDGAVGVGYANLVYSTHHLVKGRQGADHWRRFADPSGGLNLIQCAEQLEGPIEILQQTFSNCTWQNGTLDAADRTSLREPGALTTLGFALGLRDYPRVAVQEGTTLQKTALQYIENHDHPRFVCNFAMAREGNELLWEGSRELWYKVQPYLIGLLTAPGIPLLWQGQEFGENYYLPDQGFGRVALFRPVRWDYFYDDPGRSVIRLVRALLDLRRSKPQFRDGEHFFYNDDARYQRNEVLLFSRSLGERFSLVALNFGDVDRVVPFAFPKDGAYAEELHGHGLEGVTAGSETWIAVPSNYGRIWTAAG